MDMDATTSYATGKRKNAIARTWLTPGTGQVVINRRSVDEYFQRASHRLMMHPPLEITGLLGKYDIFATVCGGGQTGQVLALRHAVAKAIVELNPAHRETLKKEGFLTRDPRKKERRKYGQKGARAKFQFSKR
jgi:small subunit ribosomal protein S9